MSYCVFEVLFYSECEFIILHAILWSCTQHAFDSKIGSGIELVSINPLIKDSSRMEVAPQQQTNCSRLAGVVYYSMRR